MTSKYVAPEHAQVFLRAAKTFQVWIMVRVSNQMAWRFYRGTGYWPKRLDIKAKTAMIDLGVYELAGLVADPNIHPGAFGGRNMQDVRKLWQETLPHIYVQQPGETRTYLPHGKLYSVEPDRKHKHYGCLYFTKYGLISNKLFVCGDYDLYGLVSAKDPGQHLFVEETMLGKDHVRTPELRDVQYFLNRELGAPLIQHGAQESFLLHQDERVVVFWPDGVTATEAKDKQEIEELSGLFPRSLAGRRTKRPRQRSRIPGSGKRPDSLPVAQRRRRPTVLRVLGPTDSVVPWKSTACIQSRDPRQCEFAGRCCTRY